MLEHNTTTEEYLQGLSVLCVEDNKTTQILYDSLLEDLVGEIVVAYNGNEGYEKFQNNKIDIIISDYDMPECNGLDMIRKIRKMNENIPIIFVSAIEEIDIFIDALALDVNSFARKPIINDDIIKALRNATKLLIANEVLKEQKEKELYRKYQEDLGFSKELNILRNDFYHQMVLSNGISLVDFMYEPLDVLSGDAYSARIIDKDTTFYLVVDRMGKGLSASLTAMSMTSFVNHTFDNMIEANNFNLNDLVCEAMKYIKVILLEEEALAIDFVVVDYAQNIMEYAKFAMPVLLMSNEDEEIVRIKSNNAPLCKWSEDCTIDTYDITDISKFLLYSDGIVENETTIEGKTYADYIEEDFLNAFTKDDLKQSFFDKVQIKEDDITFVYIHRLCCLNVGVQSKVFETSLASLDIAYDWYENLWTSLSDSPKESYGANLVFTELFMNAYEHGNLGIDAGHKNSLLEDDIYFETLLEKEKLCDKKIWVTLKEVAKGKSKYIITQITDEGNGFDMDILNQIFKNTQAFNGRGVFVSQKNSVGIYYNEKGNHVLYLNKVS